MNEKGKEAVMDDDSEPSDMADRAYKEWLEEAIFKGMEEWAHISKAEWPPHRFFDCSACLWGFFP